MYYVEELVRDGPSQGSGLWTRTEGWTGEARERDQDWVGEDGICQKVLKPFRIRSPETAALIGNQGPSLWGAGRMQVQRGQ